MTSSSPADHHPPATASVARIAWPALAGFMTFLVAAAIALQQMARSNRPHELTRAPLVALIQLLAVGLLALALVRLERAFSNRDTESVSRGHWLLLVLLLPVSALAALFLFGSVSTAIEVLRA